MAITPDPPFPKSSGDNIRSKDWNDAVREIQRLDTAKLDMAGGRINGPLSIDGVVGLGIPTPNTRLEVLNNRDALAIESQQHALMTRSSAAGNSIDMFMGTDATREAGYLQAVKRGVGKVPLLIQPQGGNVGIGTTAPAFAKLDIRDADTTVQFRSSMSTLVTGSNNGGAIYFGVDNANNKNAPTAGIETSWGGGTNPQLGIGVTRDFAGGKAANILLEYLGNINIRQGTTSRLFVQGDTGRPGEMGNIGVGNTSPAFPLSFPNLLGDKISLWGSPGPHYGFGIQPGLLQIHTDGSGSDIAFGFGSSGSFTETMRIKGNGRLGIGTTNPTRPLTVESASGAYVNARSTAADGPFEVLLGADTNGGIVSTMTNHDLQLRAGGNNTKLTIKADGNVGIGTASPFTKLTLAGSLGFTNASSPMMFIYESGTGNPERAVAAHSPGAPTWGLFYNDATDQMIFKRAGTPVMTVLLGVGGPAVKIDGPLTATGGKGGYIVDQFVNKHGDTLEEGDVVVIGRDQASLYYGLDHKIPVPEADIAQQAYDTRVCGIVHEIHVDIPTEISPAPSTGLNEAFGTIKKAAPTKSGIIRRKGKKTEAVEPQIFGRDELERLDRTKIGPDQIGLMVTLGAYAHCKVDADIASINVGDLLTTSPTKGHAQKVLDPGKAVGAIIGKALGGLKKGKGKIPVIVSLQ